MAQLRAGNFSFLRKSSSLFYQERRDVLLNISRHWRSRPRTEDSEKSFKADDLEISMMPYEKLQKKPSKDSLKLWRHFTDYMFSVRWDYAHGWATPKIDPVGSFRIHPASKCLNYGVEVIEDMMAYRGQDGHVRIFRPDLNIENFLGGCKKLLLPSFDPNEFIECIKRLVKLEMDWIPDEEGSCLYIRPVFIGTDPSLAVTACKSALMYVLLCPVSENSEDDIKPISLYANPDHVKSWPGGNGDINVGGNYCTLIYTQKLAWEQGCQRVLWLQGHDYKILEISNMNVFFIIQNDNGESQLVTPPLNGLIVNGPVRQSVLELCEEWNEFRFYEKTITMKEFKDLLNQRRLREIFGAGATNIITPVSSILFEGSKFDIPTVKQNQPIYARIRATLTDIYYGKIDHDWAVRVDS